MWLKRWTPQNIVIGGAGRRPAAGDRLGGGHRHAPLNAWLLFADHLPVDAAALLGAGALHQRRLRQGRRADDAGGRGRRRDPRADPDLQPAAGRRSALAPWPAPAWPARLYGVRRRWSLGAGCWRSARATSTGVRARRPRRPSRATRATCSPSRSSTCSCCSPPCWPSTCCGCRAGSGQHMAILMADTDKRRNRPHRGATASRRRDRSPSRSRSAFSSSWSSSSPSSGGRRSGAADVTTSNRLNPAAQRPKTSRAAA